LNFYHELGFSELSVGDIRDYHYGVVTDGRIALGLHAGGIDEPALSFVKSGVASYLQRVTPDDEELSFSRLGTETFHEVGVRTPDGHLLIMMEARTFSRVRLSELPAPVTGHSVEISLGCRDLDKATNYWSDAGFMAIREQIEDTPGGVVELLAPGLRLGLRTDLPPGQSVLRFAPDELDQALESLDRRNVPVRHMGHCQSHRVTAPEGTHLDLVAAEARTKDDS
jgi:catechol 2,3-dioxygenase-like lactoylglutathione lyase family enzyme